MKIPAVRRPFVILAAGFVVSMSVPLGPAVAQYDETPYEYCIDDCNVNWTGNTDSYGYQQCRLQCYYAHGSAAGGGGGGNGTSPISNGTTYGNGYNTQPSGGFRGSPGNPVPTS